MRLWLARAALAAVSTYLSLVVGQYLLPYVTGTEVRRPFDTPFLRSSVAIAEELRAKGQDASPLLYPSIWLDEMLPGGPDLLPLGSTSRQLTVFCEEQPDTPVVYTSDEHGFRNERVETSAVRAAAIGDSFTQGACVGAGKGFVAIMARRVGPILNLGQSGNGPLLELATLKEYASVLRPATVFWFYYPGNDLWDLQRESRRLLLKRYLEDGFRQGLSGRQDEIDRRLRGWLDEARMRFDAERFTQLIDGESGSLVRFTRLLSLEPLRTMTQIARENASVDIDLFRRVMDNARRTVAGWDGRLVFVVLPDHRPVQRLPLLPRSNHERVLAAIRELGIPLIDAEEATRDVSRSELFFYSTSHYSERGNEIVGDRVLDALARLPTR